MANPFLLGFGKAFAGLGQDLEQRDLLNYQRSLLAKQQERQNATDALSRLVTLQGIGGQELQPGDDPTAAQQGLTDFNAMRSGGAIPNSALGVDDSETPSFYGAPRVVKLPNADGTFSNILIDPSRTPQALAERRFSTQQRFMDQRQQSKLDAASALEQKKEDARTQAGLLSARADYNTLKSEFPDDALVQSPFDPNNAANYGKAIDFRRQQALQRTAQPRNIDPLSPQGVSAAVSRAQQIAALKPKTLTPDQVRMQTVNDLAAPAANALLSYYSGTPSTIGEMESSALHHIPLVGTKLGNYADEGYQTALQNAHVLATQYLEAMPKSRFQPSTVEDIAKQIAPIAGDSPTQRAQKAARVRDLQRAIKKRALNPTDLPDPSGLDDAPMPPGMQP